MVRLGGAASPTYISVFRGLKAHFLRHGIEIDWVLYSDYDALVEAFVRREIDLAWNAPLAYVKIKRRLQDPCRVVANGSPWGHGRRCRPGCCRTISCSS